MAVPFKKRLQRYHKESLDTLFRTLQFKQGVQRFAPQTSVNFFEVTLTDADLIGSTPGTAFTTPISVPAGKYVRVTVDRIFTAGATQYDGSLVFGLIGPGNTYFSLPGAPNLDSISTDRQTYRTTSSIGIWHSVGAAPTVGDGIMKFRVEYEFFDLP